MDNQLKIVCDTIDTFNNLIYQAILLIDITNGDVLYSKGSDKLIITKHKGTEAANIPDINNVFAPESQQTFTRKVLTSFYALFSTMPEDDQQKCSLIYDSECAKGRRHLALTHKLSSLMIAGHKNIFMDVVCYASRTSYTSPIAILDSKKMYQYDIKNNLWTERKAYAITAVEQNIIRMALLGYSSKQMAKAANVSTDTIRSEKKLLYDKLHVRNLPEAIAFVSNYRIFCPLDMDKM